MLHGKLPSAALKIVAIIPLILVIQTTIKLANAESEIKCTHQFQLAHQQRHDLNPTKASDDDDGGVDNGMSMYYTFLDDTQQCDSQLNQELLDANGVQPCPDGLIAIGMQPHSVFPFQSNNIPFVLLNISLAGQANAISHIYYQLRCVHAPNLNDYLCHKHTVQVEKWGHMIWPCRRLELLLNSTENDDQEEFHFSYMCHPLFGLSQYVIEIFVHRKAQQQPQFCRRTLLLTTPLDRQLDPAINDFYGDAKQLLFKSTKSRQQRPARTSPLLFLDTSPLDAIYVHLVPVALAYRHVNISIFTLENAGTKVTLLTSERLFLQSGSEKHFLWRWNDIDPGEYMIYAFFDDGHCQLSCKKNDEEGDEECECAHTSLNLTLAEPKHTTWLRRRLMLTSVGKYMALFIFVVLFLVFLFSLAGLFYMRVWRPRALARQPPQNVELTNRPVVLVLYTDDCQAHADVVVELCRVLEQNANARCLLDQWEFVENPGVRPSIWLTEKLAECDFVLVIFSACSPRVLAGERLVQRRHFPDFFNTAMGFVLAKMNEIASAEGVWHGHSSAKHQHKLPNDHCSQPGGNHHQQHPTLSSATNNNNNAALHESNNNNSNSRLNRFIFVRFAYSPPHSIPPFFACSHPGQPGPLVLPVQIGHLIARLHGIRGGAEWDQQQQQRMTAGAWANGDAARFEHQAELAPLNAAIGKLQKFQDETPNWMSKRFMAAERNNDDIQQEDGNRPLAKMVQNRRIPTVAEQRELAEQFGLLKADEEEDEEEEQAQQRMNDDTNADDDSVNPHPQQRPHSSAKKKKYGIVGRLEDYDSGEEGDPG